MNRILIFLSILLTGTLSFSTLTYHEVKTLRRHFVVPVEQALGADVGRATSGVSSNLSLITLNVSGLSTLSGGVSSTQATFNPGPIIVTNGTNTSTLASSFLAVNGTADGRAQLYAKASSTVSTGLKIEGSSGTRIMSAASSTLLFPITSLDIEFLVNGVALVEIGNATDLGGALRLNGNADGGGGLLINRNATAVGVIVSTNEVSIGDGVTTSSLYNSSLVLGRTAGFKSGTVNVNSVFGNVTASGTIIAGDAAATYGFQTAATKSILLNGRLDLGSSSCFIRESSGMQLTCSAQPIYFSSSVGINSSTPFAKLGVNGNSIVTGTSTSANIFTTGTIMIALPENTAALANVCTDASGRFFKDSSVGCLTSNPKAKDNLAPLEMEGLKVVNALEAVEWDWKPDQARTGHDIGFNAEQASKVDPRLVAFYDNGEVKGFKYQEYTAVLTKAIQEQQKQIDELQAQVNAMSKSVSLLDRIISFIKSL